MKESETKAPIIRKMEKADVNEASELEAMVFSMPWSASDFLEMVMAPYAYYFVAEDDAGRIVGICGLRDIAGEGEITNVAVHPLARRKGIGQQLIEQVMKQCEGLGIKDVTLEVRVSNEGAIALYEKFGFKSEGIRPDFYEHPKEDAMIMWRRR